MRMVLGDGDDGLEGPRVKSFGVRVDAERLETEFGLRDLRLDVVDPLVPLLESPEVKVVRGTSVHLHKEAKEVVVHRLGEGAH